MKHYVWLSLLLLAALAVAQTAPGPRPGAPASPMAQQGPKQDEDEAPAPKVSAAQVPPTAPVITVQGLCPSPTTASARRRTAGARPAGKAAAAGASKDCSTVITRAQFEKLADALNPQMPLPTKMQLAEAYPRLLLFAQKAREMGIDKDPQFQEMMKFATLQLLAQHLTRDLQKKAGDIPESEVESYYKDNPSKFQQVELLRIFIPKSKPHPPTAGASTPPAADTAADEAAMKAEAEKIHTAAVGGGDFQALQKEAFEAAGIKSESPSVDLGKVGRDALPTTQQKVFELQAGQVSELLDEPGGFYIYKVVSKETVPLEQAKKEIHDFLQQQAFQKQMQAMIGSVKPELNPTYFGQGSGGRSRAPQGAPQPQPPTSKPPSQR